MAGIQRLAGGVHHLGHRHLGHHHVHLELGQQVHGQGHAPVVLRAALLNAAAQHLGDGHAGDADVVHGGFELLELGLVAHHRHLGQLHVGRGHGGGHQLDGHRLVHAPAAALRRGFGEGVGPRHGRQSGGGHEVGVGGGQAVFGGVQPGDLLLGGHPQAVGGADEVEHNGHGHYGIGGNGQHTQALDAQQADPAAVQQPAVGGQQAGEDSARQAAATVDRHRAHRVVDVEPGVNGFHHDHHQNAGDHAHPGGAQGVQAGAPGGDTHQPRQRGVQAHAHVGLAVLNPGKQHTGHGGRGGGNGGVAQDLGHLGGVGGRRAVETVPAEPEDKGAHGR